MHEMHKAKFQSYTAQVVAELQKKDMWVGVLPEEATMAMLSYYGTNASVLTLTPPRDSGAFTVVVKISEGETDTIVPCHQWGKQPYHRPAKG
jgi:hypothetical protein